MPTKSSAKVVAGKDPAKSKVQPPRERYVSKPMTPEERAAILAVTTREAARYTNPDVQSGFDLTVTILSATIDSGEIRCMVKVDGGVVRPEQSAISRGVLKELAVPAIITKDEGVDE